MPDFPSLVRAMESPWLLCLQRTRSNAGGMGLERHLLDLLGRKPLTNWFFFPPDFTRWRCSHSLKVLPIESLSHTPDFELHVDFNSLVGYPGVKWGRVCFLLMLRDCESVGKIKNIRNPRAEQALIIHMHVWLKQNQAQLQLSRTTFSPSVLRTF